MNAKRVRDLANHKMLDVDNMPNSISLKAPCPDVFIWGFYGGNLPRKLSLWSDRNFDSIAEKQRYDSTSGRGMRAVIYYGIACGSLGVEGDLILLILECPITRLKQGSYQIDKCDMVNNL